MCYMDAGLRGCEHDGRSLESSNVKSWLRVEYYKHVRRFATETHGGGVLGSNIGSSSGKHDGKVMIDEKRQTACIFNSVSILNSWIPISVRAIASSSVAQQYTPKGQVPNPVFCVILAIGHRQTRKIWIFKALGEGGLLLYISPLPCVTSNISFRDLLVIFDCESILPSPRTVLQHVEHHVNLLFCLCHDAPGMRLISPL